MKKLALFLTVAMLMAVLSTSTVSAWEGLESSAPPDNKYYVWDNYQGSSNVNRWTVGSTDPGAYMYIIGYYTSQDAWCQFQSTGTFYYKSSQWFIHPTRNYVAVTARMYSHHNPTLSWIGDWTMNLLLAKDGDAYTFGFCFIPASEYVAYWAIAKNGVTYQNTLYKFSLANQLCQWHYYRILLGYNMVNGVYVSWVWFFVGYDLTNNWIKVGEMNLQQAYGFGGYLSGAGVGDYPVCIYWGWHGQPSVQSNFGIGIDFIARKLDSESPFP